jgi:hypothetical protein
VFDEAKAREFYVDFLGFTIDWEHRFGHNFPLYVQISRDDCTLHLSEHHGDCSPGAAIRIETAVLDDLLAELRAVTTSTRNRTLSRPRGASVCCPLAIRSETG